MFCPYCGKQAPDAARFCPSCGAKGKIYLKCGFKNDPVQVASEQLDFVVAELARRCPQARVV